MPKARAAAAGMMSLARRRAFLGLAAAASIAVVTAGWARAQQQPPASATVEFTGGAVAVGIGFSWGSGVVTFEGKKYPISVSGLSALDVGASRFSASGVVRNLKNINDVQGTFMAAEVGATVAGGGSISSMRNDRGVIIDLTSSRAGLQFTIAPKGVTIRLR